jgi:D-sedoheptulose 7-phosphate isomerase
VNWNQYLAATQAALQAVDPVSLEALERSVLRAWETVHTVFTCGNGGSASNASHLAQDLSKGTLIPGVPPLRAISLCDSVSALTAWANDNGYTTVFSQQLAALARSGDLLIAISGSGNSTNVLNAVNMAHELEMHTWGITGFDGGHLRYHAHRFVQVSVHNMGIVEAAHSVLFHWLVEGVRERRLSIMDSGAWCPGVER